MNQQKDYYHSSCLQVDMFLLRPTVPHQQQQQPKNHSSPSSIENLLELAKIAVQINQYIRNHIHNPKQPHLDYPWIMGAPPAFGIHSSTTGIPHLRALVSYGPVAVADEYHMIAILLRDISVQFPNLAIECWDRQDGQILLILSAEELPAWVEQIGPEACQHRCWIRNGNILLLPPHSLAAPLSFSKLSLQQALLLLLQSNDPLRIHSSGAGVVVETFHSNVIQKLVQRSYYATTHWHTTAVLLPRAAAGLFHRRPSLISSACVAFANSCHNNTTTTTITPPSPLEGKYEDFVWTRLRFGRTAYAMLCSIQKPPMWLDLESSMIPSEYQTLETKRLERICKNEATPHLKKALYIGVRLVAGLDYLLRQEEPTEKKKESHSAESHILKSWAQIDIACGRQAEWLRNAWIAGPNHSEHSLENVLKCPVFSDEVEGGMVAPLSHPSMTTLTDQVREGLKQKSQILDGDTPPGPSQVDSESWMEFPDDETINRDVLGLSINNRSFGDKEAVVDDLVDGFKQFMNSEADPEGVNNIPGFKGPIQINAKVALAILHDVLKSKDSESMKDWAGCDSVDNDEFGDDEDDLEIDSEMDEAMNAMDEELKVKGSRILDDVSHSDIDEASELALDVHLAKNLLESIESQGASAGPVRTILQEMGLDVPDL